MKKEVVLVLLALVLTLLISGCVTQNTVKNTENQGTPQKTEKVIITKIVDGDTVIIQGGETVRLLGIDTPERGEPYYSEAKQYLENRILFKEVSLESDIENRDVYKRLLRWIWLDNSLIDLEQIQNGFAISRLYDGEKYQTEIKNAENLAIDQRIGIWSRLNENPNNSTQNQASLNNQTTTLNSDSPNSDACISLGCPPGTQYVASKNSDKYHACPCYNAKRIKPENLLCFSSKEEAEQSRVLASCG